MALANLINLTNMTLRCENYLEVTKTNLINLTNLELRCELFMSGSKIVETAKASSIKSIFVTAKCDICYLIQRL